METEKEVLEDKPNFRVMQIEQIKALLQMGEKPTRNLLIVFDEKLKIQFSANGFYEALQVGYIYIMIEMVNEILDSGLGIYSILTLNWLV